MYICIHICIYIWSKETYRKDPANHQRYSKGEFVFHQRMSLKTISLLKKRDCFQRHCETLSLLFQYWGPSNTVSFSMSLMTLSIKTDSLIRERLFESKVSLKGDLLQLKRPSEWKETSEKGLSITRFDSLLGSISLALIWLRAVMNQNRPQLIQVMNQNRPRGGVGFFSNERGFSVESSLQGISYNFLL